jgi:hypothetical protein
VIRLVSGALLALTLAVAVPAAAQSPSGDLASMRPRITATDTAGRRPRVHYWLAPRWQVDLLSIARRRALDEYGDFRAENRVAESWVVRRGRNGEFVATGRSPLPPGRYYVLVRARRLQSVIFGAYTVATTPVAVISVR